MYELLKEAKPFIQLYSYTDDLYQKIGVSE
jgi:hypothetical protein